ncbi:MAG: TMEM165/GDT1 family protein [Anaerolineae bacterium]|nr:TMEM165/GDT1 family protein [Anaerolineae bacterium]
MDWQILISTFGLVFIAELGDKTQLAVMTQTCKFRRPWSVFLGGSFALIAVTALGAAGGRLLSTLVPEGVIRAIAALGFVIMGTVIWREAHKRDADADNACALDEACSDRASGWDWRAFGTTFSLLFFAELGDKTQLAVLGIASKQPVVWSVFAGGALALTVVTALGVLGGEQLCRLIPEKLLLTISGVAFVLMGILMAFGVI